MAKQSEIRPGRMRIFDWEVDFGVEEVVDCPADVRDMFSDSFDL